MLTAFGGMLALASSQGICRFVYTPILPAMAAGLGMGSSTAGLIASANFLGYLGGAIAATLKRLPGGRRAWFIGSLCVSATSTAAMGVASGLPAYLALRFAGGASGAFVLVLATAAVLDALADAGRSRLGALHYAGVGVGIALSAVVVAGLEMGGAGWRTLWIVAGLIALALIPLPADVLRWRAPAIDAAARPTPMGRGVLRLSICQFLFGSGYAVTATFLIAMVRAAPATRTVEPLIWTVVGLCAAPSLLLWLWVSARIGSRRAYAAAAVLEAAGVLLAGGWPTAAGLLVGAALLGGTFMGLTALGFAVAREFGPGGQ
ncbi:MAG: YbfB/YjiJ family MFS transporter, partial [Janthinobacterium lividum]